MNGYKKPIIKPFDVTNVREFEKHTNCSGAN